MNKFLINEKLVFAVIPAAGTGSRMNAGQNKQFMQIGRYPVIVRTLRVFEKHPAIKGYLVVAAPAEVNAMRSLLDQFGLKKCLGVTAGGDSRTQSVLNGLEALTCATGFLPASLVLVHDGARCFVTPEIISRVIEGIQKHGACGAAVPVKDTIKRADSHGRVCETPERSQLWAMQTPQGAAFEMLRNASRDAIEQGFFGTDDLAVLEKAGIPVYLVDGDYQNIKLTTPEDRLIAEQLAVQMDCKTSDED